MKRPIGTPWGPISLLIYLFVSIVPLIVIGKRAFFENYGTASVFLLEHRQVTLWLRTILIAMGTALGSGGSGVLCALALRCFDQRLRRILLVLLVIPLFIPPYILGLAWPRLGTLWEWKISGPWWTTGLLVACYFPLIMSLTLGGLNAINRTIIDAAKLRWGWIGTWQHILVPLVGRNIAIGFVLVFLLAIGEYGLASVLQVQTFPIEIMTEFSAFYDEGAAVRLCVPLLFAGVGGVIVLKLLVGTRYRQVIPGRSGSFEWNVGPVLSGLAWGFLGIVFLMTVATPIFVLINGLEGWQSFSEAWRTAHKQVLQSFLFCSVCAGMAMVLGWPLARMQLHSSKGASWLIDLLTLLPLTIPGSIVGVGFIILWNRPWLSWFSGSWLILPLVLLARFFPLAQKSLVTTFGMTHESIWAATSIAPRHKIVRLFHIELPIMKRGILVAVLSIFVLAFRELSATVLVTPPGCETLVLRTYTLSHYGADDLVMALCLISIGVMLAGYALTLMLLKKNK